MERKPDLRPAAACVVVGLCAVAATVFARRIAVASLPDLPAGEAAAYAAAFAWAALAAVRRLTDEFGASASRAADAGVLILTLCFVSGLTTAGFGVLTCLVACLAVAALLRLPIADRFTLGSDRMQGVTGAVDPHGPSEEAAEGADMTQHETRSDALRLVRSTRDGRQILNGLIRFEVPPGEIVQTLHVPLWPPLDGVPDVTCELEEIDGRVRVPVAKPYGLRIEVRVPEPSDEPLEGAVRFVAECRPATSAA